MANIAPIENGKVVSNTQPAKTSSGDGMDKDTFLQLLVAQMKYQDPLEPTSNTEYVSQYAQFSQVESIQSMAGSMDLQRASQLVGKDVNVKATSGNGDQYLIQGRVDSVVYEGGKAFLSIDESLYPISDLDSVVDSDYLKAYNNATDWVTKLNKLPSVHNIDLNSKEVVEELSERYDKMSSYDKSFIASEKVSALKEYVAKMEELSNASEEKEDVSDAANAVAGEDLAEKLTEDHSEE